jgi:hypothetical protein
LTEASSPLLYYVRRIEEVRRETEAIRKANAALKRLYDNNHEGMKRLADS